MTDSSALRVKKLRADKQLIDSLPTPVALSLKQLSDAAEARGKGKRSLIVLWHACDAVESILRLMVFVAIAELHGQKRLGPIAERLAQAIDRPTLGQWRRLLETLTGQLAPDTMLQELKQQAAKGWLLGRFFGGDPKKKGAKEDPLESFLALRNRMAHGAGLAHEAAGTLLDKWEKRIDEFFEECLWLRELSFVAYRGGPDDRQVYRLVGPAPQALSDVVTPSWPDDEMVTVARNGDALQVWPLICYGVPQLTEGEAKHSTVQLYARRSAIDTLQYTPLDTIEAYWSFGDRHATSVLDGMLLRDQRKENALATVGAAASFAGELFNESKQMIGRESELRKVRTALEEHRGGLLWLDGEPGSGKSTMMAKLAVQLLDETATQGQKTKRVLPFRFKVGDGRCSAEEFFKLIEQALKPSLARSGHGGYSFPTTAEALKKAVADGTDYVILLDGLDEIDSIDQRFVNDVCLALAAQLKSESSNPGRGCVTWLCAGRPQLTPRLTDAGAIRLFPDGLPGMSEQDIRAMLLDRIGKARNTLIAKEGIKNTDIIQIDGAKDLVGELDDGRVPTQILVGCRIDPVAIASVPIDLRPRALRISKGKRWLIDNRDNHEMAFVEFSHKNSKLSLHIDRVDSPFVTAVAERSKGLPIYLRCVVNDVLGNGDMAHFESTKLPKSLEAFYQHLIKRSGIGDVAKLLTPIVSMIAVARDSINKEQLAVLARSELRYRKLENVPNDIDDALRHLAPMLRPSQDRLNLPGYTIYHKSFRDYLDPPDDESAAKADPRFSRSSDVETSIFTAKWWLCRKSSEAAEHGIEHVGPFADYVAYHGIDHLLEIDGVELLSDMGEPGSHYNGLAPALQLYETLAQKPNLEKYQLELAGLTMMAKRIADAVSNLVEQMRDAKDPTSQRNALLRAQALPVESLVAVIQAIYETSTRKGAIRVLAQLHAEKWNALRHQLHSPYDMVLRVDIGEVMADLWADAVGEEKVERLQQLVAMTQDDRLEEREIAGYALQQVYEEAPIDAAVVQRWAKADNYVEQMILGELVQRLAGNDQDRMAPLLAAIPPADYTQFWHPVWEYHRIDLDSYWLEQAAKLPEADWPALAAQAKDPGLIARVREDRQLKDHLAALRGRASVRSRPDLAQLLTPEGFAGLGHDASAISDDDKPFDQLSAVLDADRRTGLDILKALTMHSMWHVAEQVASALERLVRRNIDHMSIVRDWLVDRNANWRMSYAAIDAAYNVSGRDGYKLFEAGVKLHYNNASSRVRGIVADDFLAWLRMGDEATQKHILNSAELCDVIKFWVEDARDCWLLEYVHLILRFLHHDLEQDVARFLPDKLSPLLGNDRLFYECERDEFLRRIERNRAADSGHGEFR